MKRDFIINFSLILLTILAGVSAATLNLWFSAVGAFILLLCIVYRQFTLFDRYKEMLFAERDAQRQACNISTDSQAELLFYKALMDGVETAIMSVTDSGYAEWMNRAAKQIVGNGELLPAEIMQAVRKHSYTLRLDGNEYSISCSRVIMRNSCRNIIAMKNIHDAMEKNKVDAWHKLVRVLTHEIMNSMTPIISLSETLCDSMRSNTFAGDDDNVANIRRGFEIINRRSSGLLSFVENYRKLTRLAAPDKRSFPVVSLVDDIKELFPQPFIKFDSANVGDTHICADRAQIEQVFINILKNAVEACEERENATNRPSEYEKQIHCTVHRISDKSGADTIAISVRDNGNGILDSVQEQIFVPFFTTKKQGCGIGLSLCKQIVINHGGTIEISADEDSGCTVICRLPQS